MEFFTDELLPPITPDVSSGDGIVRTNEQMEEWAKQEGCDYIEATDSELFIDIDTKEQLATFWNNLNLAHRLFDHVPSDKLGYWGRQQIKITDSKQGGDHKHIRVKLWAPLDIKDRILLQACLGSDLKRELISWKRAQEGEKNVVIFFEKRPKADVGA